MTNRPAKEINKDVDKLKAALKDQVFSGADVARVLGSDIRGTGGIFKYMVKRHDVRKIRSGAYQFVSASQATTPAHITPAAVPSAPPIAASELLSTPMFFKAGGYFIKHDTILIAGCHTPDKVVLFTSVLELETEGTSKFVRNKRIVFAKSQEPDEYAAVMAYLRTNASVPETTPEDAQAALQLAEEATAKLNAARQEIDVLKARIKKISAAFAEATV